MWVHWKATVNTATAPVGVIAVTSHFPFSCSVLNVLIHFLSIFYVFPVRKTFNVHFKEFKFTVLGTFKGIWFFIMTFKGTRFQKTSLVEKVTKTFLSSELMEFFSFLKNCLIFGGKCQLANLFEEWPDLSKCDTTFLIVLCEWLDFFCDLPYLYARNHLPLTLPQE